MECPFCEHENIEGVDQCACCDADLAGVDDVNALDIEHGLMTVHLGEVACDDYVAVSPDETVGAVVGKMAGQGGHCALVVKEGEVVGMFTERDVLNKLALEYAESVDRPVSDFMTAHPEMLDADDSVGFALNRMVVGGYRHLPILHDGKLAGVVSVKHVFGYLSTKFGDVVVQ